MRLITSKGQLHLPSDFAFTIEQNSPVFSQEGTQSIPVSLPDSDVNKAALSYPTRPGRKDKFIRKIPAKLEAGIIHKSGKLLIESAERESGILGSIMLNESDFYSQIRDVKLPDIFGKIIRDDFSQSSDKVEDWYQYIYDCMVGDETDDFTAFPVAVNLTGGKYQLLNGPDTSSERTVWDLKYQARRVAYGDETINVPLGYGVTPFLWLWRMIELLFAEYDYTVRLNPFKTDNFLNKIALVNNTADSICKGTLNYGDLVPSGTVSEFVTFLADKMLSHIYIYPESKSVDIVPLNSVLLSEADMDITAILHGNEKYTFTDTFEVSIEPDTSLEGAEPAMETLFDLANKYTHIGVLSESDFRNNAYKYNLVLRKSTGDYYEILRKPPTSEVQISKLGSNYFRYFTRRLPAKEYKSTDLIPPMVELKTGLIGSKEANVICPYIGTSRHRNTSYKEKTADAEQKIIIALNAGVSDEDAIIAAKYILGTTQKYDNMGNLWSMYDLTTTDLYTLFFKEWNKYLMNSGIEMEARVDYLPEQILSLKMDLPKIFKGQKILLKNLSYSVGNKVSNILSKFLLLRSLTPLVTDPAVSFIEQLYTWDYESNFGELFAPFDTQEWDSYTWDYVGSDNPSNTSFEYLPPPTAAQFTSGALYYSQSNDIKIYAKKPGDPLTYTFDRVLTSGFRAVEI